MRRDFNQENLIQQKAGSTIPLKKWSSNPEGDALRSGVLEEGNCGRICSDDPLHPRLWLVIEDELLPAGVNTWYLFPVVVLLEEASEGLCVSVRASCLFLCTGVAFSARRNPLKAFGGLRIWCGHLRGWAETMSSPPEANQPDQHSEIIAASTRAPIFTHIGWRNIQQGYSEEGRLIYTYFTLMSLLCFPLTIEPCVCVCLWCTVHMAAIWSGRAEQDPGVVLHMQPVYIKTHS